MKGCRNVEGVDRTGIEFEERDLLGFAKLSSQEELRDLERLRDERFFPMVFRYVIIYSWYRNLQLGISHSMYVAVDGVL